MKYQRFVSLSAALSFILIFISSGVLYFLPDRSVTSWTSWRFLGLDKQQWDNLHINLGIFFLVMIVWHIYFNWKPIKNYLKVKREWKIFTREFNVALIWVILFTVGTITMTQPFSFLVNIGNGIKALNSLKDGNPPFAYAEYAPLQAFCTLTDIDSARAMEKLEQKNIHVASLKTTLKEIASANAISPRDIFDIIKETNTRFGLPTDIPVGIAHKTPKELGKEYRMDAQKFIDRLKIYGAKADMNMSFKRIAKANNLHPAQLYNILMASQYKCTKKPNSTEN
jgi:hypothetical protein